MRSLKSRPRERRLPRRATTLLEITAAGAILGVLLIVCAQMLSRTAVQQQAISNRRAALQMVSNAMERVYALPWDDLDATNTKTIARTVVEQGMLRGGRLDVTVDEPETTPASRRIIATVIWSEGSDEVERKQQLTAWRYAPALEKAMKPDSTKLSQLPGGSQ